MADAMAKPEFSYDLDATQVARYILTLDAARPKPDVTQLKLQKLLYLAQANYLASTGHRLFSASVEAFDNGPVVYRVLKAYSAFADSVIAPASTECNFTTVPRDARAFLDAVWDRYKDWSSTELWNLTHSQRPWMDHYEPGAFRKAIPDEAMAEYFRAEVAVNERVLHPNVVVMNPAILDELDKDEDEIVARAVEALR